MYADYKTHILSKYKSWRDAQHLSPLLNQPTPGNLRTACANLCQERFDKKDELILKTFFGPCENQTAYMNTIADFEVDKFRPLWKFITGRIADTRIENIELLAWLMDVQPRPFQPGYPYEKLPIKPEPDNNGNTDNPDESLKAEKVIEENDVVDPGNASVDTVKGPNPSDKRPIYIAVSLLFFIIVSVFLIGRILPGGTCMYWAVDRYKKVDCDKTIEGALVIAADTGKLLHFKKITRPDTITLKAIGYVWYSKIDNKPEFFTADGYHPIQIHYHLKPITKYIIDKYVHPGMPLN